MLNKIDEDFYCSAGYEFTDMENGDVCPMQLHLPEEDRDCKNCGCCHRKHPTPEQYKEEYGRKYSDSGAVYMYIPDWQRYNNWGWIVKEFRQARELGRPRDINPIVCACTPFEKPNDDWRPE